MIPAPLPLSVYDGMYFGHMVSNPPVSFFEDTEVQASKRRMLETFDFLTHLEIVQGTLYRSVRSKFSL